MAKEKVHYSFLPGTRQVKFEDYPKLQDKLYEIIGCSSLQEYYRKRKNYVNIPAHVKESIEKVFAEFGINDPTEIWEIKQGLK